MNSHTTFTALERRVRREAREAAYAEAVAAHDATRAAYTEAVKTWETIRHSFAYDDPLAQPAIAAAYARLLVARAASNLANLRLITTPSGHRPQ